MEHPHDPHPPPAFSRQSSSVNKINPVAYDPEHAPPTCRSALRHGPEAIRDHVKHYFACIEISKRAAFFDADDPIWKYELEREVKAAHALMPGVPITNESVQSRAMKRVKAMKGSLAVAIENEYERTKLLRKALMDAPDPPTRQNTVYQNILEGGMLSRGHLVKCLEESCGEWKASSKYQEGIKLVRDWKKGSGGVPKSSPPDETATRAPSPAAPEAEPLDAELDRIRQVITECTGRPPPADQGVPDYAVERDVNAYLIQYTRSPDMATSTTDTLDSRYLMPTDEQLADGRFKGHFPGQRLSIKALLGDFEHSAGSVLSKSQCEDTDPTRIRYFHLPSNNMQVRARYSCSADRLELTCPFLISG